MSMTDLEIDEAIREAWTILYAGPAVSPSAHRLAAALLAVTGDTPAHSRWVTPDDLWRDRLAVLAEQGAWLAAWGPRPGEPDCRVPPALLPENRTRRENAYLLWRSTVPITSAVTSEGRTARKPASRSRRRNYTDQPDPAPFRSRRRRLPPPDPDGVRD